MISFDIYQKALKNLELQHENYKSLDPSTETLIKEAVKESLIQRFEICFESASKALEKYLIDEFSVQGAKQSVRAILKKANEFELFSSSLESWMEYQNCRNMTSHEYGVENLEKIIEILPAFIDDAIGLYQTMSKHTWE